MTAAPRLLRTSGHRILVVMATAAEYGPALRDRITPVITGVGPVEAAIGTTRALQDCLDHQGLPDLVLSLGSAGSRRLEQGAVYQVSAVSYRDMDASPLGFEKGRTPFLDLPAELALPLRLREVPAARLSTGANIVSGPAYDAIDADMVDMETFAVLRACQQFGVPMIGLRGISDGAEELRHYDDWTALLGHLDREMAAIIDRLETLLLPD
ncbi:MAG: 5'-methylthioadenosine/S-adenosylhomocysteine nucleosidase [Beijerinckiaceae bacterium]|nr:5'-methylthioadenosine/S-adenosylhomocysteine nucleosidase [Beijerinckiaceae bacterium]MCZ8301045.1 5'-methylthioadenosine/S-adenosylhomocysteine nucleosidase [Beijerinckiaceae bacterium]